MNWTVALAPLLLSGWAGGLFLLRLVWERLASRVVLPLNLVGLGLTLVTLLSLHHQIPLAAGGLALDGLAFLAQILLLVAAGLVVMLGQGWEEFPRRYQTEYQAILDWTTAGMMLVAGARDFLLLYLALELSVVGFCLLVAWRGEEPLGVEAALKFVLLAVVTSLLMAAGMAILYALTGTMDLAEVGRRLAKLGIPRLPVQAGLGLLLVGLGFEAALIPLHSWAPDTYQGAPTPVTALLLTASKIAGFVAMARVFALGMGGVARLWAPLVGWLAVLSMLGGNLLALPQQEMKRLLAYSGIAQSGYLALGLLGGKRGVETVLFYLFLYTLATMTALVVVTLHERRTGETTLASYAGLSRHSPFLAGAMLVALLALAGIPPVIVGKFLLFAVALGRGYTSLVLLGTVTGVISMAYYLRVVKQMYLLPPPPVVFPLRAGIWPWLALVIALMGTVGVGLFPQGVLRILEVGG